MLFADNPYGGNEGPCQCCGRFVDDCICGECPRCTEQGNPGCYARNDFGGHGMKYNREQLMGQQKLVIAELEDRVQDAGMYLAYLETCDDNKLPQFINDSNPNNGETDPDGDAVGP